MKSALVFLAFLCTLSACNSQRSNSNITEEPKYRLDIHLEDSLSPNTLEEAFKAYGLQQQGRSSRSQNRWMFTYDHATTGVKSLIEKISAYEGVIDADAYPINDQD
jgi:hypothetical protein